MFCDMFSLAPLRFLAEHECQRRQGQLTGPQPAASACNNYDADVGRQVQDGEQVVGNIEPVDQQGEYEPLRSPAGVEPLEKP